MATSEENDLIGYDPLAWMEGIVGNEEVIDESDDDSDIAKEPEPVIEDDVLDMTDELEDADDLIETPVDEPVLNADQEDQISIEEIESDTDNAVIDEIADEDMAASDDVQESATDYSLGSQIDLDAVLNIQNVVDLHEKLKAILASHDQIEINASDVASIDTATLQLLVSLKKDSGKLQKEVTIIYPSPRFVESARLLGLLDVLEVQDA